MKIFRISFLVFSIFLITYAVSFAQPNVKFFDDEAAFNNTCGGLAFEDFEDTNIPPLAFAFCFPVLSPLNSLTDNDCYSPGALIPGFSLTPSSFVMGLSTPPQNGLTNVAVGGSSGNVQTIITFAEDVSAVGMVLVNQSPAITNAGGISVFGIGGAFLGTATVNLTSANGHFLGIQTNHPISRIEIETLEITNGSTLMYELSFGQCEFLTNVPTLSEWGLIAMAGVLGIVGFMVIRRRKVTA